MKRFEFSLERLLSLRIFYEKEAEIALQRAVGERDIVKIEIENINARIVDSSHHFSQDLSVVDLLAIENYIKGLKVKKLRLQEELIKLDRVVRECLLKYQEASKNRKILDKLKEKKLEEWKDELNKEEIIVIDEVVSSKFAMQ